jgi:hypothetical protein
MKLGSALDIGHPDKALCPPDIPEAFFTEDLAHGKTGLI